MKLFSLLPKRLVHLACNSPVSAFPRRCGCGAAFVRVWRVGVDLIHPWDKPMGVSCLCCCGFSVARGAGPGVESRWHA